MRKPISPATHGLIDYGFGLVNMTIPAVLGLTGVAKTIPMVAALAQGTLNAFTEISRKIPFSTHGWLETAGVPTLVAVSAASGAMKKPKARNYYLGLFAALGIVYMLTDWNATPKR